jgi:hypothetical protein
MAKKAPASPLKKAPAKRKPRPKKPPVIKTETGVELSEFSPETLIRLQEILDAKLNPEKIKLHDPTDYGEPVQSKILSAIAYVLPCLIAVVIGVGIGVYAAGGIQIGGDVVPVADDCLSQAHAADRVTQIAVLRELAEQPFDGTTDEGRRKAGEWFNAQRFRNRADDFGAYTDAVSEAIASNSEAELAKKLEGK